MSLTGRIARLLGALCVGGLVACAGDVPPDSANVSQAAEQLNIDPKVAVAAENSVSVRKVSELAYHDAWRKLWEDHIEWTRMVIIGVFDCLAGNDAYTARLLQNYEDMEDALKPFYDEDDVEAFGDLVKDHLTIAAGILVAAKNGDTETMNAQIAVWRDNGHALAAQMNKMNPEFWALDSTDAMWQSHLDVTLAEAVGHLTGDWTGEIAAWEEVHRGGLMMADLFSRGTMAAKPKLFEGCLMK